VELKDGFEFCIRTDNALKWGTTRQKVVLLIDVLMLILLASCRRPSRAGWPTCLEAIT
jgi:hypothetical protein